MSHAELANEQTCQMTTASSSSSSSSPARHRIDSDPGTHVKNEKRATDDIRLCLNMAASVSSFESNTVEQFRRNLSGALRQELTNASRTLSGGGVVIENNNHNKEVVVRYDACQFEKALLHQVAWNELCQAHDAHLERRQQRQQQQQPSTSQKSRPHNLSTTALQELLEHCLNPCLVPRVCAKILVRVWMATLVQSPSRRHHGHTLHAPQAQQQQQRQRPPHQQVTVPEPVGSRWSFSQLLLLKSMVQILATSPGLQTSFHELLLEHVTTLLSFSHNRQRRLLSIIQYLAHDTLLHAIPSLNYSFLVSILTMIQMLDDIDLASTLRQGSSALDDSSKSSCLYCSRKHHLLHLQERDNPSSKKRIKSNNNGQMLFSEVLHDTETIGDGIAVQTCLSTRQHQHPWYQPKGRSHVSFLNVLQASVGAKSNGSSSISSRPVYCANCVLDAQTPSANAKTTPKREPNNESFSREWKSVQSRAFQKFLSIGTTTTTTTATTMFRSMDLPRGTTYVQRHSAHRYGWGSIAASADSVRPYADFHLPMLLLDMAFHNYSSPSWRACLLVWAAYQQKEHGGNISRQLATGNGLSTTSSAATNLGDAALCLVPTIALNCWSCYMTTQNSVWLRLYSEWIVECSHFDEPVVARKVLIPLVQYVMAQQQSFQRSHEQQEKECASSSAVVRSKSKSREVLVKSGVWCSSTERQSNRPSGDSRPRPSFLGPDMLACLLYLFSSRRGWLFYSQTTFENHDQSNNDDATLFRTFMTTLAVYYGETKYWLSEKITDLQEEQTVTTLQRMGILGIQLHASDDEPIQNWDFDKECSISGNLDHNENTNRNQGEDENWEFDEEYDFDDDKGSTEGGSQVQDDNDWEFDEEFDDLDGFEGDRHSSTDDDHDDFRATDTRQPQGVSVKNGNAISRSPSPSESTKCSQSDKDIDVDIGAVNCRVIGNVKHSNGLASEALATDSTRSDQSQKESQKDLDAVATWPFAIPYDLRSAYERMRRSHLSTVNIAFSNTAKTEYDAFGPNALSTIFSDDENPYIKNGEGHGSHRPDAAAKDSYVEKAAVMDYLHNDLLRIVFSYFGYKRLVKIRQVCHNWKELSDTSNFLWFGAYRSRFGVLPQDPRVGNSYDGSCTLCPFSGSITTRNPNHETRQNNWKALFRTKWTAEQSLRFRRHQQTGWKYRTCGYVGCFKVVMSAAKQEAHYQVHVRAEEKQRERDERTRQREEKKRLQQKAKALKSPARNNKRSEKKG